jgi:hypothetical protein
LHRLQVAALIDQRVAEVLESDAVKESLQARLEAERKVGRVHGHSQHVGRTAARAEQRPNNQQLSAALITPVAARRSSPSSHILNL